MSQKANISRFRRIGNTVYTSGVTGKPGDVPTQIKNVMEKLREILRDAGSSFEEVVRVTIYLSDLSFREQYMNAIWNEYFPKPESAPSRTTIEVGLGPDTFVEIEMVAVAK